MMVMPNPSQSFWIVETVVLLLRPLTMLFTVDWVTPLLVHKALIEMSCFWHSSIILWRTASPTVMADLPLSLQYVKKEYTNALVKVTSFELK